MDLHRKLIRCKWGLASFAVGLTGSSVSLTIIYTLSAKGQWLPQSVFGHRVYAVTFVLGMIAIGLALVGTWKDKWPWLGLIALLPGVLCLLIGGSE